MSGFTRQSTKNKNKDNKNIFSFLSTDEDGGQEDNKEIIQEVPFVAVKTKKINRKKPKEPEGPPPSLPKIVEIPKIKKASFKNSDDHSEPSFGPDDESDTDSLNYRDSSNGAFTIEAGKQLGESLMAHFSSMLTNAIQAQETKNSQFESLLVSMHQSISQPSSSSLKDPASSTAPALTVLKTKKTKIPSKQVGTQSKSKSTPIKKVRIQKQEEEDSDCFGSDDDSIASQDRDNNQLEDLSKARIQKLLVEEDLSDDGFGSDANSIASQERDSHYEDLSKTKEIAQRDVEQKQERLRQQARDAANAKGFASKLVSSLLIFLLLLNQCQQHILSMRHDRDSVFNTEQDDAAPVISFFKKDCAFAQDSPIMVSAIKKLTKIQTSNEGFPSVIRDQVIGTELLVIDLKSLPGVYSQPLSIVNLTSSHVYETIICLEAKLYNTVKDYIVLGTVPDQAFIKNSVPCNFNGIYGFIREMQNQCGIDSNFVLFLAEPHVQMKIFQKWQKPFKSLESLLFGSSGGWKRFDQKFTWFMCVQMSFLDLCYKCIITSVIIDLNELTESFTEKWLSKYHHRITTTTELDVIVRVKLFKLFCQLKASECDTCHLKGQPQTSLRFSRCDSNSIKTSPTASRADAPTGAPDNSAYIKMYTEFKVWKDKQASGIDVTTKNYYFVELNIAMGFPPKFFNISKVNIGASIISKSSCPFLRSVNKQGGMTNLVIENN